MFVAVKNAEEVTLTRACFNCGESQSTEVQTSELKSYEDGLFVQKAFPNMSAADREFFFLSGFCGGCWDKLIVDG